MSLEAATRADDIARRNGHFSEDAESPLPHSAPLELGVVAAALVHPGLAAEIGPDVPNLFFDPELARALSHIQALASDGKPVDLNLLKAQAEAAGENVTDMVGHLTSAIYGGTPTPSMAKQYVDQLRELAARREAVLLGFDLQKRGRTLGAAELLEIAEQGRERVGRIVQVASGRFTFTSATELMNEQNETPYLIRGILPAGQPGLVAGRFKSMKTSTVCEMAAAVVSGRPFLGEFLVPERKPVAFLSGESGRTKIAGTFRRICKARALGYSDLADIHFSTQIPDLKDGADVGELARFIRKQQIGLAIVDPAYLALSAAADSMGNAPAVGSLLRRLSTAASETGAAIALVAHSRKTAGVPGEPPELGEVAHAGLCEWARWWLLLAPRKPFDAETGTHQLWMVAGGSEGHSGCWGLHVHEGRHDQPGGQVWLTSLQSRGALINDERREREEAKVGAREQTQAAKLIAERTSLARVLAKFPEGETKETIRTRMGVSGQVLSRIIAASLDAGDIEECLVPKGKRKGGYEGFKLAEKALTDNV